MNILGKMLLRRLPASIRRGILAELFQATADAFGCAVPAYGHLSYDERLRTYALFTREEAEKALQPAGDTPAAKARLYHDAHRLGRRLRRWLGVETLEEVMALAQLLYQAIGVDMQGAAQGEAQCSVTISRCYFSQFYSGPVCDLISAVDDGVFSGLSGGSRLAFSARLTEGGECCRATLRLQESGHP